MAPDARSTVAVSDPSDAAPASGVQLSAAFVAHIPDYAERGRFWAKRLRIPDQEVDDLVQDALEAMWLHLPELSPEVWLAWFDATLKNKNKRRRRDHARWKQNEPRYANAAEVSAHPAAFRPVAMLESRWLVAKVGRIIDALEPDLRVVAQRYLLENEPLDEIAVSLGKPYHTIRNDWRLAREAIEAQIDRDHAKERLHLGAAGAFLLLLFARLAALFRRGGAMACSSPPARVSPPDARLSGARRPARLLVLGLVLGAAALVTSAVLVVATPEAILSTDEDPPPSTETIATVGLFLPAWAEREIERAPGVRVAPSPARPPSTNAPVRSSVAAARPVPPLLSKAREALRLGRFTEAAAALHDFEIDHPDPNKDALHRSLRIEVELRGLDAAPLIQ